MITNNLMISVAIMLFFFSFEITNAMNYDYANIYENTTGVYNPNVKEITPPQTHDSSSINLTSILDTSGNIYEVQGSNYGAISEATLIYNTLINSTVGFYDFIHTLLGIQPGPNAVSILIGLVNFMVLINHAFALSQVVGKIFGG